MMIRNDVASYTAAQVWPFLDGMGKDLVPSGGDRNRSPIPFRFTYALAMGPVTALVAGALERAAEELGADREPVPGTVHKVAQDALVGVLGARAVRYHVDNLIARGGVLRYYDGRTPERAAWRWDPAALAAVAPKRPPVLYLHPDLVPLAGSARRALVYLVLWALVNLEPFVPGLHEPIGNGKRALVGSWSRLSGLFPWRISVGQAVERLADRGLVYLRTMPDRERGRLVQVVEV